MAFVHIPTRFEDPFESVLDDLLDLTFPPLRYQPSERHSHGPHFLTHGGQRPYPYHHNVRQYPFQLGQTSRTDEDKFTVRLDVRHYTPEEINLKIEDNKLVVSGKHRRQGENGYELSEFQRSYQLPDNVDQSTLTSKISPDGILIAEAAKKRSMEPNTSFLPLGLKATEDNYKVAIGTADYKPEEITVKVNGRQLSVSGQQELRESGEHGDHVHHRQFHRAFMIPKDGNLDAIQSKMQGDGTLVINIPRSAALLPEEKVIPITFEPEGKDEEDKEAKMEQ